MKIEIFVDYLQVEMNNQTHRIYHENFRPFVESQSLLFDTSKNGEHEQEETQIDYFSILYDKPKLKELLITHLAYETI